MDIVLLIGACFLFFICSSLILNRMVLILQFEHLTKFQISFLLICGYLGNIMAVNIYDLAKRANLIKCFIIAVIILQCVQLFMYNVNNFAILAISVTLIYICTQVADLCCNIVGEYVPYMLSVFLRNCGALVAAYIHTRIDYVHVLQSKHIFSYLASASIICMLLTRVQTRLRFTQVVWSIDDVWVLYSEYSGLFWAFICSNILEIILLRHCTYVVSVLKNDMRFASHIDLLLNAGRIVIHYPLMVFLNRYISSWRIIILQSINLICIMALPLAFYYTHITTYILAFVIGGLTLIRHAISMQFNHTLKNNKIALDVVLNKIRNICFIISFCLEIVIIIHPNLLAYIIVLILAASTILSMINCVV